MPLYIAKSGDLDRCYRCLTVDPNIEDEIDFPSKNADRLMPILVMKMSMNQQNEVVYMFYRKLQCNKFTMMEWSALPERVKRSTMINEALRRLLCCSPELEEHKKIEVMEEFAKMLRRSGYSEKFRFEVISDAVQRYQKMAPADRFCRYYNTKRKVQNGVVTKEGRKLDPARHAFALLW